MFQHVLEELKPLKRFSAWIWVFLGVFALVLRFFLSHNILWVEQYYSRAVFPIIRYLFDFTTAKLPVAFIYVLLVLLLLFLVTKIRKIIILKKSILAKLLYFFHLLLNIVGGLLFFFLLLWGYNYLRIPVKKQLGLVDPVLSVEDIKTELLRVKTLTIATRNKITTEDTLSAFKEEQLPLNFEEHTKKDIIQLFQTLGYPTPGNVKARQLYPKGILLRWSTAGVYIPFTGECHIDAGLHPLQKPFVLAHEYSHGLGITDEGTCNFLGFLACSKSDDPFIRYTGYLAYFRTLAVHFKRSEPEEYENIRANLPPGMIADLDAINTYMLRYPNFLPEIRDWLYDNFLKVQGVKDGVASYSRVIQMVIAWNRKNNVENVPE